MPFRSASPQRSAISGAGTTARHPGLRHSVCVDRNLGENASTINGVLYPTKGNDMAAFDAREAGYVRVEVPPDEIEALSWERLPETGKIWVYVPDAAGNPPGVGLPNPSAPFPMLESYIDVVIEGVLEVRPRLCARSH